MMNRELMKALRPVKNRLRRNRFLRGAAAGLAAGLGAAVLLQAVSFFVPVPDRGLLAVAAAAAGTVLTALGNALRPVQNTDAAKAADACGLKERAITALEGADEPIRLLQRRDACTALEKLDMKKIRPGSVRKALFAALGCAVLLSCLMLIPNPQDFAAEARKALTKTLQEGREAIALGAKEDEKELAEEQKNELRKITGDLNRELDGSRDAADVMVALDRAEQRLEEFRQKTAGDAAAADDAAGGSESRIGENLNQAGSAGENGTGGNAAQTASGQPQTMSAAAISSSAQMKTLQALASLQAAVNPSAGAIYAQAVTGTQGMQGGLGGNGANNGDRTGSGAGEGSTNEEQKGSGQSGSSVHIEGNRPAKYKEEQYETIYDPEHINRAKQDALTDQNRLSDEDSLQLETGPGRGNLSGDVPWNDALQEYSDTEARAADRENLTVQERQWVDEYYRLLTEQN